MTENERQHLEKRLLQERERALRALTRFDEQSRVGGRDDDGELSTYPVHPADEGTDTMEREQNSLLASKEGRLVYWIDDALRLLYKEPERYGRCFECGEPIIFDRLDIVPWTQLCVSCQRAEEEGQRRAA
jgi:DnaK suppressor protein